MRKLVAVALFSLLCVSAQADSITDSYTTTDTVNVSVTRAHQIEGGTTDLTNGALFFDLYGSNISVAGLSHDGSTVNPWTQDVPILGEGFGTIDGVQYKSLGYEGYISLNNIGLLKFCTYQGCETDPTAQLYNVRFDPAGSYDLTGFSPTDPIAVPEPPSILLLVIGLMAVAAIYRAKEEY